MMSRTAHARAAPAQEASAIARPVRRSLVALAAIAAVACPFAAPAASSRAAVGIERLVSREQLRLAAGVVATLNEIRAAHRLAPLSVDPGLDEAALQHTRQMLSLGYFAHTSANGSPFWARIRRFYPSTHFAEWQVGENLLWSAGGLDARRALALWMASPSHRANILSTRWQQIGVAVRTAPRGPGVFDDRPVTVVTVDFGIRTDA
jgi:uncharacterized protein YkwD